MGRQFRKFVVALGLSAMLGVSHAQAVDPVALRRAMEVHDIHSAELFEGQGVVGTGVGVAADGQPVIKVFIRGGRGKGLPPQVEGLPVEIIFSGKVFALANDCSGPKESRPDWCSDPEPAPDGGDVDATARFDRPVPIGVSSGHGDITAGSVGCLVDAGCHNYVLTNNHVYANEGQANLGDDVLQPGPMDGGLSPDDTIGTLYDYEPIIFSASADNRIDAALARVEDGLVGDSTPEDGYGRPRTDPIEAVPGMDVMKYGRTTGQTTGWVEAINATIMVQYDSGVARFVDQIVIRPGPFSDAGDSGSLVVAEGGENDRRPVGLLFAGSHSVTIANPINEVLARFGASVVGE